MKISLKNISLVIFGIAYLIFSSQLALAGSVKLIGSVNSDNINLRVDATVGSAVICVLSKGEQVEIVSEAYDWYKIRLPQKAPSYIRKDLVECANPHPVAEPGRCSAAKVIENRINVRLEPNESSWILGKIDKLTIVNIISENNGWYRIQPVYSSFGWVNKKFISQVKKGE